MADTGLKQSEIISQVLDTVWRIRTPWLAPGMAPARRMEILVRCVFKALDTLEIPHPTVEYEAGMKASTGNSGLYSGWTLSVDSSSATDEAVAAEGDLELRECLDTVYHETRHHEQHFRATYYWLTVGTAKPTFKNNLGVWSGNGANIPQGMVTSFGIPLPFAQAYWKMITARFQYSGDALDETKAWYEEYFGRYSNEQAAIMNSLAQPNRRASVYDLYRTIKIEDDGWATGYKCGDAYLARAFNERKANLTATIEAAEAKLVLLKARHSNRQAGFVRGVDRFKAEGGEVLKNKLKQIGAELKTEETRLKGYEAAINGQKTELARQKGETVTLLRRHRDSMTAHRVNGVGSRQRRRYGPGSTATT